MCGSASSELGGIRWTHSGEFSFAYAPDWLTHPDAFPISVRLPLRVAPWTGAEAAAWFGNLLPEGTAREAVWGRLGIPVGNDLDLLAAIGGECAGALRVLPNEPPPARDRQDTFEALAPLQIASLMDGGSAPLASHAKMPTGGWALSGGVCRAGGSTYCATAGGSATPRGMAGFQCRCWQLRRACQEPVAALRSRRRAPRAVL